MKKIILLFDFCILTFALSSQSITAKLSTAFNQFEKDPQLKHAISSLHVIDAKTGKIVFSKNSQIGLAPASTQKIITAVTAFELLGKDYRYKTLFGVFGNELYIKGSGDPTLGSWRWEKTKQENVLKRMDEAFNLSNIERLNDVFIDIKNWEIPAIPDGWIWQDIGNYYGAAAQNFNWQENQFDIVLKSGKKIGDPVEITGISIPEVSFYGRESFVTSAARGTGDNAYVYHLFKTDNYSPQLIVRGTIPIDEDNFKISASMVSPKEIFARLLFDSLQTHFKYDKPFSSRLHWIDYNEEAKIVHTEYSPTLDSIIYWFLQKSVNLYGEALLKTFAYEKNGFGSTDDGIKILKNFWKQKGIDEDELDVLDGSGLSPQNRVTTNAEVEILKYAKTKDWFPSFYNAIPEYNNMKMKSGTIRGVKGFTGYHTSRSGQEYIFAFLVNNYNGSHSALVNKMYRVLNVLK